MGRQADHLRKQLIKAWRSARLIPQIPNGALRNLLEHALYLRLRSVTHEGVGRSMSRVLQPNARYRILLAEGYRTCLHLAPTHYCAKVRRLTQIARSVLSACVHSTRQSAEYRGVRSHTCSPFHLSPVAPARLHEARKNLIDALEVMLTELDLCAFRVLIASNPPRSRETGVHTLETSSSVAADSPEPTLFL